MSFTEKFQPGESYGDPRKAAGGILADPLKLATDLLKDYSGLRSQASVKEIAELIKEVLSSGEPLDDKKGYVDSTSVRDHVLTLIVPLSFSLAS